MWYSSLFVMLCMVPSKNVLGERKAKFHIIFSMREAPLLTRKYVHILKKIQYYLTTNIFPCQWTGCLCLVAERNTVLELATHLDKNLNPTYDPGMKCDICTACIAHTSNTNSNAQNRTCVYDDHIMVSCRVKLANVFQQRKVTIIKSSPIWEKNTLSHLQPLKP